MALSYSIQFIDECKIGIPRILQTLNNFNVCGSIPFAQSITITALSLPLMYDTYPLKIFMPGRI